MEEWFLVDFLADDGRHDCHEIGDSLLVQCQLISFLLEHFEEVHDLDKAEVLGHYCEAINVLHEVPEYLLWDIESCLSLHEDTFEKLIDS